MRVFFYGSIPFVCCMLGYLIAAYMVQVTDVATPDLVGRLLSEALPILSEMQLYGHIMVEQEDADIPVGTILAQMPSAGCRIKTRQSVGLIVIKKPKKLLSPSCVGKTIEEIGKEAESLGVRLKVHELGVSGVVGALYAQYPYAGQEFVDPVMHIYWVDSGERCHLMPDFRGQTTKAAREILSPLGINVRVIHADRATHGDHDCSSCIIKDQKPAPDEVIDRNKMQVFYVQAGQNY